jgi:hypothetical protein
MISLRPSKGLKIMVLRWWGKGIMLSEVHKNSLSRFWLLYFKWKFVLSASLLLVYSWWNAIVQIIIKNKVYSMKIETKSSMGNGKRYGQGLKKWYISEISCKGLFDVHFNTNLTYYLKKKTTIFKCRIITTSILNLNIPNQIS